MNGWMWTAGLTGLALTGAALAPRWGLTSPSPTPHAPVGSTAPAGPASATGPVTMTAALDRDAVLRGRSEVRFVTVTITPPAAASQTARRDVDLQLVLDVSGSMADAGKLSQAKRSAHYLIDHLAPNDRLGLVTFSDAARRLAPLATPEDRTRLHAAVDTLFAAGGTNLYDGVQTALGSRSQVRDGAIGRIVVLSDGHANVGRTDPGDLAALAAAGQVAGTTVSTVGLGLEFNEDLLGAMADAGGGSYAFIGDAADLAATFADELTSASAVAARSAVLDLRLPPGVTGVEVLGWPATRTATGWTVGLGDLYASTPRTVVAKVEVTAEAGDVFDAVHAHLSYVGDTADTVDTASATARARVTDDAVDADGAINAAVTLMAGRAEGYALLERSTRAYATGDVDQAQQALSSAMRRMKDAETAADATGALAEEVDEMRLQSATYDQAAPTSDAGKAAIKDGKEKYRVRTR
ncbi:MAG: VWA domain-containing protein [Alphaproteobacteria bacterium]|nr:VWA domain-containing protein [Alphaproteobacteria bacterium]